MNMYPKLGTDLVAPYSHTIGFPTESSMAHIILSHPFFRCVWLRDFFYIERSFLKYKNVEMVL